LLAAQGVFAVEACAGRTSGIVLVATSYIPEDMSYSGDTGTLEGSDTFEGRPIRVRFAWSGITSAAPRREQAFSDDGGRMRGISYYYSPA
jgi:hypothetical protein